jgi:hypothetical protein
MTARIPLAYELNTGQPVSIPPDRHIICVGLTQQSGKSTTLEAMANQLTGRAVAFITKPGERAFESGETVPPFFLEPQISIETPMWQFVRALMEAKLGENIEPEKKRLMVVCRGASKLAQVYENTQKEFGRKHGGHVFVALLEYLEMVMPEMLKIGATNKLKLQRGLNVMDLRNLSDGMKHLVISSVLRWVHAHEHNTTVIIPEAWKIVPAGRNSPVLLAAEPFIREAAANGNYLWLDAQDMKSVHMTLRSSCSVFLIGRQIQEHEIDRCISSLIPEPQRPEPSELMKLRIGDFFVGYDNFRALAYVKPIWADAFACQNYARGTGPMPKAPTPPTRSRVDDLKFATATPLAAPEPSPMEKQLHDLRGDVARLAAQLNAANDENEKLKKQLAKLAKPFTESGAIHGQDGVEAQGAGSKADQGAHMTPAPPTPAPMNGKPVLVKTKADPEWHPMPETPAGMPADWLDQFWQYMRNRALVEQPAVLEVMAARPELHVSVERQILKVDGDTTRGRLALLIHDGVFDQERNGNQIHQEFLRRGWKISKDGKFYDELSAIATMGFLTVRTAKDRSKFFLAVPGMRVERLEK